MTLSHNSVRYSRATRRLLDVMYQPDVSEKTIRAVLKPSMMSLLLKGIFNADLMRSGLGGALIEKPDVNAITLAGETVLHRAIYLKQDGIVTLLLHYQASVDIPNQHGRFALHVAVYGVEKIIPSFEERFKGIVKLLLDYHADPNVVDFLGNTPLHIAASKGLDKVAHLLISKGADVNAQNKQGVTPLGCAIKGKWKVIMAPVIKLLMEKGASPMMSRDGGKDVFDTAHEKQWTHLITHNNSLSR